MKKYISLSIFAILSAFINTLHAQDIATIINNAQKNPLFETISPVLSQLVFATDSTAKITKENPVDTTTISLRGSLGIVKRVAKTKDYIAIETSKAGKIEAKLLPLINDSKIVCVVKTVCGGICDSQIFFFTTEWEPLDVEALMPAKSVEWFVAKSSIAEDKLGEVNSLLSDVNPVKYILSPANNTVIAESTLDKYLGDSFESVKPYFTKTKTLTWNKTSFR